MAKDIISKEGWGQVKGNMVTIIAQKAIDYNLDARYMARMANCESSLNPNKQSDFIQPYGREQSFGLFQIHLKAHKDVTVQQAKDPVFNAEWSAKHIKDGSAAQMWVTCHKSARLTASK